jgi:phage-related baseplate assembly protein
LRFVSDEFIYEYAALWGLTRLPPQPSQTTERFLYASSAARTIPKGVRVTDGTNIWAVDSDTSATGTYVDATVVCTVAGGATNGIAIGQVDTLVDPDLVPGCTGVANQTETVSGRDVEGVEDFRARLRDAPEAQSTCGPGGAYEAAAIAASASVADAVALGPDDGDQMAGPAPNPGEVHLLVIEGTRDKSGVLTSVVPDPGTGVITAVNGAVTPEDVRPLTDFVITGAPLFINFNAYVTYYIAESRSESAAAIEAAAQVAFAAYLLWQQSVIGRDINPSELTTRLGNAGAKRVDITEPAFSRLLRDQSARLVYSQLTYGGVEDD